MDEAARKHLPGQTQLPSRKSRATVKKRKKPDLSHANEDKGDHGKKPGKTTQENPCFEAAPASWLLPELRFLQRSAQHRPPRRGCQLRTETAGAPGTGTVLSPRPRAATCEGPRWRRGTERGLTQLAGGTVEARGADASPGDGVAFLGGPGTLADLTAVLAEGPWQAGCQERGHQGDSDSLSGS